MIRPLFSAFVCLTLTAGLMAKEPKGLEAARKEYEQAKTKDPEAAREQYVATLAKMMAGYVKDYRKSGSREHSAEMEALNAEMKKHPAPKDLDSKKLAALLPGEWESPRHEYLYKKDGSYVMLPEEKDATRGQWSLKGNQFTITEGGEKVPYTLILLNAEHLVYADKEAVFFLARGKK